MGAKKNIINYKLNSRTSNFWRLCLILIFLYFGNAIFLGMHNVIVYCVGADCSKMFTMGIFNYSELKTIISMNIIINIFK